MQEQTSGIIGGVDARQAKFAPVGSLLRDGKLVCTATLIAPTLALTAEHCVEAGGGGGDHASRWKFALGYDSTAPERIVGVRGSVAETSVRGGGIGLGSDVAVLYLSEPIRDVAPATLGLEPLNAEDIGKPFLAIGFGKQSADGANGTRKFGTVTLDLLQGALDSGVERALLEGYEAYFRRSTGDVQVCHGDSGGPLVDASPKLTIRGVASWVPAQDASVLCGRGETYATFGPKTRKFLDDALTAEAVRAPNASDAGTSTSDARHD
jgi:hypothetical protein